GNVAIDVARILAKDAGELAGSDLSSEVVAWLAGQPIETIHLVGRRSAADAKFNDHELAELGTLQRAQPVVADPESLAGDSTVVNTLRGFAGNARTAPVSINFHFNLTPTAFLGDGKLRAVQFRSSGEEIVEIPAQLAVTCIGYETRACCAAEPANGVFANDNGKVEDGLYVVGWAKRGPSGTIPTNRVEAQQVAQRMAQEVNDGQRRGGEGLRLLLGQRGVSWVDYAGWKRIDAAEVARASAERCREKFSTTAQMLELVRAGELRPA
ncbi:MAG: hypothetical protein WA655_02955, partial [Candidatus Korobacteraceae bacterium]